MTTAKAYAKINLSLVAIGKYGDFHELDTVVISIDLFDKVVVRPRKDDKITLKVVGADDIPPEHNNAYKAALSFKERFNTSGADITLYKGIPNSGGLGGSSASSAATLKAMAKAFKIGEDLVDVANLTGSDTAFQLKGGFARLRGRGEKIEFFDKIPKIHFTVAIPEKGVNTKECFETYDRVGGDGLADNDKLISLLLNDGKVDKNNIVNSLYRSAVSLNGEIERIIRASEALCPIATGMTGSGSTVFSIFETRELCEWAADKLIKEGIRAIAVDSVSPFAVEK